MTESHTELTYLPTVTNCIENTFAAVQSLLPQTDISKLANQFTDTIMDTSNSTTVATPSASATERIANRSVSDGARSVDSGVVLRDAPDQSDQSNQIQSHYGLSKLFRLESRTIVCEYTFNIKQSNVLTSFQ
jgi:hypothetical protein